MKKDKSAKNPTECPICQNRTVCADCGTCHYCYNGTE